MEEKALLLTRMEDLCGKAQKTGVAHSRFLTPQEGAEVSRAYANRRDVALQLDGGFAGAERCVAVFTQPDWGVYQPYEVLAGLRLAHRAQDIVRHQDVLGAVLGLGLSRDVLGDILIEPGRASTVCLASMAGFIMAELDKVGRVGVKVSRLALEELPSLAPALQEKQASVASLRLDAVLAAAFNLSRGDAAEAIKAGRVQLAHRECLNPAQAVAAGDILSLRGKGRARLLAANGLSRKGKLRITLGMF